MQALRILIAFTFLLAASLSCMAQSVATVQTKDFSKLKGFWTGSLTYLDYSTGQPYIMPADVSIKQIGNTNQFVFSNSYPDEPQANSIDTLTISNDGTTINGEKIVSISKEKKSTIVTTEVAGTDGNEDAKATIRHVYYLSKKQYKVIKEVQFAGQSNWIKRHEYSYSKAKKKKRKTKQK